MKHVTLQVFSLFLIIALLANTAGITVFYHFCAEEGIASLSFIQEDNCCQGEKHTLKSQSEKHSCCKSKASSIAKVNPKSDCCSKDIFSAQWKINEYSFFKKVVLKNYSIVAPIIFAAKFSSMEEKTSVPYFHSPPLLKSSRDILNTTSVLLI